MRRRGWTQGNRGGIDGKAVLLLLLIVGVTACKKDYFPKPMAYPRIAYPTAQYRGVSPAGTKVEFEYPSFCRFENGQSGSNRQGFNLHFTGYGATLHLTLTRIPTADIPTVLEEKERLVQSEAPPSSVTEKTNFEGSSTHYKGRLYQTNGATPIPVQFSLTDNAHTVLTGSLVFEGSVNQDSLSNVIEGMTTDVRHLMETFRSHP